MKAAVYHKPGDIRVDKVEDPAVLDDRDAIVRVTSTAICGSDLHIYDGFFPQIKNLVMGHEFMGIVEEVGKGVKNLKKGDRVVVPFPVSCGHCFFCNLGLQTHCENSNPEHYGPQGDLLDGKGAGLFGYTDLYGGYAGGQAEFVRVPFADYGPRKVPENLPDNKVLFLTDIFPTGYTAIDWGNLKGGETVAIFGSGPVGLMAQKSAWLRDAGRVIAVDPLDYRLDMASSVNKVETINPKKVDPIEAIRELTGGRGADVCVDAVGMEADRNLLDKALAAVKLEMGSIEVLENCFEAVRRGGVVSVVGVYGIPCRNFPIHRIFDKGLTIRAGQAPVQHYIDKLFDWVREDKVSLDDIVTHEVPLSRASEAYNIFKNKKEDCVKVILKP